MIDSGVASCRPCDSSCETCVERSDKCIDCAEFRVKTTGDACICETDYVEINGQCVDAGCSDIPFCQRCVLILGTSQKICRGCIDNRVLSADNLTCLCRAGFYEESDTCLECGSGCQSCNSPTDCSLCAFGARNLGDGTCICNSSYYLNYNENQNAIVCERCDPNCMTCVDSPSNCLECKNGFVANDQNVCECPDGTYPSPDNVRCLNCSNGCGMCTSVQVCDECRDGYFLDSNNRCIYECPVGTFPSVNECKQCSPNCRACTTSINCRSCLQGFFLYGGSCRSQCLPGTYALSNVCIACAP